MGFLGLYRHLLLSMVLCQTLSGCMVGPNFHSPKQPNVSRYTNTPLSEKTARLTKNGVGKAQRFMVGEDIPSDWWHLYHSKALNALIERGLANSPNLAKSQAALRQARETLRAQIGNSLFPAFDLGLNGQRQLFPGSTLNDDFPSSIFNVFNATVNVSYTLDVFGGMRRQIESLQAQVDYQQFELIASYLTLTSNIATTAVTVAALDDQIQATKALIKYQKNVLKIIKAQFQAGAASMEDVLTQETLVQQTMATLPEFEQSYARAYHALSVLVGEYPNSQLPLIKLKDLNLPANIPVSLPSKLVCQRPDVQGQDALLHAASAQIGVATANMLPQFTLTGNYGWSGAAPSTLFQAVNKTWAYGGGITQPLFHGGALFAQRRAAIAAYDEAYAMYKQTVLQAFQNVADSLRAVENDAKKYKALRLAELTAYKNVRLTKKQYDLGGVSYLTLLNIQLQYQQTVISRIQAEAARYNDTTALFQALGGGWWNRKQGFCRLGSEVGKERCRG